MPGDFWLQFLPFHTFAAHQLAAGKPALWDPYMFSGYPFQADIQTAVAYPIAAANEWLGGTGFGYLALEWEAIVHFGLAATFTFLLVELLTGSTAAGLLGGVVFAFGGFLTSYPSQQLPVLESTVWLPLELYCLERAARALGWAAAARNEPLGAGEGADDGSPMFRLGLPTAAAPADQLAAEGGKGSSLPEGGALTAWRWAASGRWLAAAGAAVGLAVLAGHPQTVLYLAYLGAAYFLFRLPWRAWWLAIWAVLPAAGLAAIQLLPSLQLFQINHKGGVAFGYAAGGLFPSDFAALIFDQPNGGRILYFGLLPLTLAILGVAFVRNRQVIFWACVAVVGGLLALGTYGPLFQLFFAVLPGWNLFRDQERAVVWVAMAAAILSGWGLAALVRRVPHRWGLALGAAAIAVSFGNLLWANGGNNLSPDPPRLDAVDALLQPVLADKDIFRVRISEESLGHNTGNLKGLQFVSGDSPFELQAFKDWTEDEGGPSGGGRVPEWQLLRLTNSHYVVASRELCSPCTDADGLRLLASQDVPAGARILESQRGAAPPSRRLYLYQVLYPLPRALFFQHAQPVGNFNDPRETGERQAIDELRQPTFDAASTLLVNSPVRVTGPPDPNAKLTTNLTGYAPGFVQVHTISDRPAYLFLSEINYPGWRATVDGAPAKPLVADGLFTALDLQPGDHQVVLQYVPAPFYIGAALSGLTLLALAIAWGTALVPSRAALAERRVLRKRLSGLDAQVPVA